MKLKTNKLLTLTLASSLVAITAGCGGGTKTPAATTGSGNGNGGNEIADVAYSAWSGSDDVTIAADDTDNGFLAGVAATTTPTVAPVTLTGVTTGATVETLNLNSIVTAATTTSGTAPNIVKGVSAVRLGGLNGATNGVAFAHNGDSTPADLRYFAGVIAGADLGQPITATTVTGTWAGLFQAVGADPIRKAFTLTVTFSATADDTISALIPVDADSFTADAMSYYLSGTYDADGVITGNILYGDFSATATDTAGALGVAVTAFGTATDDAATGAATNGVGTLSGLIGEDGVLGAFYSSGADGDGATGFAGGFVASKNPDVGGDDLDNVYADWAAGATQAADTTGDNAFLASNAAGDALTGTPASGVTPSTLNLASQVAAAVTLVQGSSTDVDGTDGRTVEILGGSADNSVEFFTNPGATAADAQFFAGLHSTTDLGAPITATADVQGVWAGLFQAVGAGDYATAAKPITLTVTFSATADDTITGLVGANTNDDAFSTADGTSYYIRGTYDANGVITGNVLYSDLSAATARPAALTAAGSALGLAIADGAASPATDGLGVLSGLIGQDGVVGAFYSNANGATGYAGGFVASTDANTGGVVTTADAYVDPATVVNLADWTLTAATDLTANGFVVGTATGGTGQTTGAVTISRATPALGGVTFFRSGTAAAEFYHAAIHSDTALGAPASTTDGTGTWTGMFGAVGETGYATAARTAMFAISFGTTRTIQGTVAAGTATFAAGVPAYHINATYTAAGLISGNILYQGTSAAADAGVTSAGTATVATAGFGTVTGLIGAEGLVGAFHSNATTGSTGATGYSGGFIAAPGS